MKQTTTTPSGVFLFVLKHQTKMWPGPGTNNWGFLEKPLQRVNRSTQPQPDRPRLGAKRAQHLLWSIPATRRNQRWNTGTNGILFTGDLTPNGPKKPKTESWKKEGNLLELLFFLLQVANLGGESVYTFWIKPALAQGRRWMMNQPSNVKKLLCLEVLSLLLDIPQASAVNISYCASNCFNRFL